MRTSVLALLSLLLFILAVSNHPQRQPPERITSTGDMPITLNLPEPIDATDVPAACRKLGQEALVQGIKVDKERCAIYRLHADPPSPWSEKTCPAVTDGMTVSVTIFKGKIKYGELRPRAECRDPPH